MITRDQERAVHAFECVRSLNQSKINQSVRDDYKILVNGFGASIVRSGLAATFAFVERDKSKEAVTHFLKHLSNAGIPFLDDDKGNSLPGDAIAAKVRSLEVDQYMIVTRELLKVSQWLKRAVQAEFQSKEGA